MQGPPKRTQGTLLVVIVAVFIVALALSWLFHGTGVIHNDLKRNIHIPEDLIMPLQIKAAYNGEKIFFRYRWPAKQPSIYHDMLNFEGGKWVRHGDSVPGPEPDGIYEDRVTMLVDDGNFLDVLPLVNPGFLTLMPFGVTLISKALFGLALGWMLRGSMLTSPLSLGSRKAAGRYRPRE